MEQYGKKERPDIGEGEQVERLEREQFGVVGGPRAGGEVEGASQLGDRCGDAVFFFFFSGPPRGQFIIE